MLELFQGFEEIILFLLFLVSTFGLAYFITKKYSNVFLEFGLNLLCRFVGMEKKFISRKNGEGVWCYAEKKGANFHNHQNDIKNKKHPILVFVHGFGGDIYTWPSMIRFIPKNYHCVMIDMPGHGQTTFLEEIDQPNVESYVKGLKEFLEVSGLDQLKITLIGCSLGGAVVSLFTHYYPENVDKLCLMCPAIRTPTLSNTCQELLKGNYKHLMPRNGKEFTEMVALLSSKKTYYPEIIMQAWVDLNFTPKKMVVFEKLLKSLLEDDFVNFEKKFELMKEIKKDSIIIWGEDDEMLDVSGAYFLNENIKNSQLKIIKNCNHIIQLDKPRYATKLLVEFING